MDSQGLSLTVGVPASVPPVISTTNLAPATQTRPYSASLTMSGGTGPFTWSISAGSLPTGLSLNSSTGVISGTPTGTGTSNFTVKVTDATSATNSQALNLTVNPAPVITTSSLPGALQANSYSQTLTMTGGTGPIAWGISSGSLPVGLSLNGSTGVISGTPTGTGTANFTVQVTDANSATDTQTLSIVVSAVPPVITTITLPAATQASSYSKTITLGGGVGPYTWSVVSGSLPAGLSLNSSTGVISGTPTATGTANFTVQVTDGNSMTDTQALSLVVNAVPVITTTTLTSATQASIYSYVLARTGGTGPFTWSVSAGTLPAGLSLNSSTGEITGTPTGNGTANFTIQITDANSATDTQSLSLVVIAVPKPFAEHHLRFRTGQCLQSDLDTERRYRPLHLEYRRGITAGGTESEQFERCHQWHPDRVGNLELHRPGQRYEF